MSATGDLWAAWDTRLLAARLGGEEMRAAVALGRLILENGSTVGRVGERRLREATGLHGRSLIRARDGLAAKALIQYRPGGRGPGNGTIYRLRLDVTTRRRQEARPASETTIAEKARVAYRLAGGNLEGDANREALDRQAQALVAAGHDEGIILAAVADLGRERGYAGQLSARVKGAGPALVEVAA